MKKRDLRRIKKILKMEREKNKLLFKLPDGIVDVNSIGVRTTKDFMIKEVGVEFTEGRYFSSVVDGVPFYSFE